MSVHLKYGAVHPRTLLADLAGRAGEGADTLRTELAWRDFYADVLWHHPETARENFDRRYDALPWDSGAEADAHFEAWATGRTGFPIVDAGMRQLRETAWVHNRVRMIVASFLVKDLHLHWTRGARHFMRYLADGDLASNQHGWQWAAGTGTDAAPFFRVFNPVSQGERFDPHGDYVRRFVPELRDVRGAAVHRPWELPGGPPGGYPSPIVDHAEERREALTRFEHVRGRSG
jgi:deoxyribodipyrimidine photo-lyase